MRAHFVAAMMLPVLAASCGGPTGERSGVTLCSAEGTLYIPANYEDKIDYLFVVDNSPGTAAKQERLKASLSVIPELLERFWSGTFVSPHFAVATSDLGAGDIATATCARVHDPEYVPIGKAAASSCKAPTGKPWLEFEAGPAGDRGSNLPSGQDLLTTLDCMLSVGEGGCEVQQPLEAAYSILHKGLSDGFLRDDALLVVVFVTGTDDGSLDASRTTGIEILGQDRYEQITARAVHCGIPSVPPPDDASDGPLLDCVALTNANDAWPLFDLSRYVDFFSHTVLQGGLKDNPLDVQLIGIDGPDAPFETILANPDVRQDEDYVECDARDANSTPRCLPVLQRSCQSKTDARVRAEPALRLNSVIASTRFGTALSACGDDYRRLGEPLVRYGEGDWPSCVWFRLRDPDHPECYFTDVSRQRDGTSVEKSIPPCAAAATDETCWRIETNEMLCGADGPGDGSPTGQAFVIDRRVPAPDHTTTQVQCSIPCD